MMIYYVITFSDINANSTTELCLLKIQQDLCRVIVCERDNEIMVSTLMKMIGMTNEMVIDIILLFLKYDSMIKENLVIVGDGLQLQ